MKSSNLSQHQKDEIIDLVLNTRVTYRKIAEYTNTSTKEICEVIDEYCEKNGYKTLARKKDRVIFIDKNGEQKECKTEKTSKKGNLAIIKIIEEWVRENGRKPRQGIRGIKACDRIKELSLEEQKELRLGQILHVIKTNIVKKYEHKTLEEIENEDHREMVRIIRELDNQYNVSKSLLNARELQEWVREKERLPRHKIKPAIKDGKIEELSLAEQKEVRIGQNLNRIKKEMNEIYKDKKLEEIENETHREMVRIIRELDDKYGESRTNVDMTKVSKDKLAEEILVLAKTKNATEEQIKIMASCYGVELQQIGFSQSDDSESIERE